MLWHLDSLVVKAIVRRHGCIHRCMNVLRIVDTMSQCMFARGVVKIWEGELKIVGVGSLGECVRWDAPFVWAAKEVWHLG